MFMDPFGIFAFFSLLPGYQTPAYKSRAESRGPPPSPSPWLESLVRSFVPMPAPRAPMGVDLPEGTEEPSPGKTSLKSSGGPMLILTEANDYIVPLMKDGLQGLFEDAEWTAHWHVFCADEKSFEWCRGAVKPASVCKRTEETLQGAQYHQGDYMKHVWLKWVLIRKALTGELGKVGSVLFLDADIAVLSGGRKGLEQCLLRPMSGSGELPHFQYQQSPFNGVNGGLMWFRRHKLSLDFVDAVYAKRSVGKFGDDQGWADALLKVPQFSRAKGFRQRPLPRAIFHSFCMERVWKQPITWQARTHHPTCQVGTSQKLGNNQRARKAWHESLMNLTNRGVAQMDPCSLK